MTKISIIILTYNSSMYIEALLNSLNEYREKYDIEIILIDQSCNTEYIHLSNIVKPFSLDYLINKDNTGFGSGNNFGFEICSGDIVFFCNPDVEFTSDLFNYCLDLYNGNKLGMVGFKQETGLDNLSLFFKPQYFFPFISSTLSSIFDKLKIFNPKYQFFSGALLCFDRKAFIKIGGFDENMFLYNEEADLSERCINNKIPINYCSSHSFFHNMGKRKVSINIYDRSFDSLFYYLNKHNFKLSRTYKLLKLNFYLKSKFRVINKEFYLDILNLLKKYYLKYI